MDHARAKYEFNLAHDRIDQSMDGISTITKIMNVDRIRYRAFENLINRNWLLRKFLGVKKIELEFARILEEETLAREAEDKFIAKKAEVSKKVELAKKEDEKDEKEAVKSTKARLRQIKKLEKPNAKK